MKANAKAGVFQGEMASPFLLAERPLGQVGRSIREVKVIMAITDELAQLREQTLARIAEADTSAALESVRVAVLGKAGTLTGYLRGMGKVAKEERAVVGKTVNEVRNVVEEALEARKKKLAAAEMEAAIDASAVDVTLPGRAQQMGTRHLINAITDEVSEIFLGLGYTVVHGPEVETDYYNFEALNAPKDHPSRSMQDTFYVRDLSGEASSVRGESDVLLRTQTSGVQVHVMEDQKPPIYIIAPGKVYRRDVADPSHLPQFTQIEGLVIDKGISFGDLKGTLDYFCKQMFGPIARPASARTTSRSPSPPPRPTSPAACAVARGICTTASAAACARARAGWKSSVAAWSTRTCSPCRASTRRSIPASHLASASNAWRA